MTTDQIAAEARIAIVNFLIGRIKRPLARFEEDEIETHIKSAIEKVLDVPETEILSGLWAAKELLGSIREHEKTGFNEIVDAKIERAIRAATRAAQEGKCHHQWAYYATLQMPEQGPPLPLEQCVLCGVQRKRQTLSPEHS